MKISRRKFLVIDENFHIYENFLSHIRQDSWSSYSFGKIQGVRETELFEEKV